MGALQTISLYRPLQALIPLELLFVPLKPGKHVRVCGKKSTPLKTLAKNRIRILRTPLLKSRTSVELKTLLTSIEHFCFELQVNSGHLQKALFLNPPKNLNVPLAVLAPIGISFGLQPSLSFLSLAA
jgi:hypothetical protein